MMRLYSGLLLSLGIQSVFSFSNPALDVFIEKQLPISYKEIFCNIGSQGCRAKSSGPGVMVTFSDGYWVKHTSTWVRDSALVYKTLTETFIDEYDPFLQELIQLYIASQATVQKHRNKAGRLADGKGLGNPRLKGNLDPFYSRSSHVQQDGPALRAITIITYGNWLLDNGYIVTANDVLWPLVRNDLEYISQYWRDPGYDLWGDLKAVQSFWSTMSQIRALVMGSVFANALGHDGNRYASLVPNLMCYSQTFWNDTDFFITANVDEVRHEEFERLHTRHRTGKDFNTILASTHAFDPSLLCTTTTFQPCSDVALANHKAVVDTFRDWPINPSTSLGKPIAVGRYREDHYSGGNPWYVTTLAAGEQLHDALYVWRRMGYLDVTRISLPFFKDLMPDVLVTRYHNGTTAFDAIMNRVAEYADGFMEIAASHIGSEGVMKEQFSNNNGMPRSATHSSWSYGAFISAVRRRAGVLPPSWTSGFDKEVIMVIPGADEDVSRTGTYVTPTATWFPPSQTPRTDFPTRISPFNTSVVNAPPHPVAS